MELISAILYDTSKFMVAVPLGKKLCYASGAKLEQWSVTLLPIGKPRVVENMVSMFWG